MSRLSTRRATAWLLLFLLMCLGSLYALFPGTPTAAIPVSSLAQTQAASSPATSHATGLSTGKPTQDDLQPAALPGQTVTPAWLPAPSATPTLALPTPAPWNGRERVTILVMGVDAREGEPGFGPPRTDTMILMTIDPAAKTAGMLSIPRDLWAPMPGTHKSARINAAYRWGEQARLPGGGAGYVIRAVSGLLDVKIHYYVLLDFSAFTGFIDAIGGLKMHIREEIKVDPVGPGNTVLLEPGVQTLSGPVVLGYARNRYTERGDFDRIDRQQEVILAVREQVLSLNMLPLLVSKAPGIYDSISGGIETNLTLDQVIRLAWLAAQIDEPDIHQAAFEPRDLSFERIETESGPQDVLVPKPGRIQALRARLLGEP